MLVIWNPTHISTCGSVGVFTAHVEKVLMREYPPTLEKAISAKLMEDFTIHILAQSSTLVFYQPFTKTQHHDSSVENPAPSLPPMTQSWIVNINYEGSDLWLVSLFFFLYLEQEKQ